MGLFGLLFTVLAFNGPLTIVVGYITVVIGMGNGLGAPVAYIATGVLIWLFSVGFIKMAGHLPNPGGFYAFITAGLGKLPGLGASFVALICYYFILLGVYAFNGVLMNSLVHDTLNGPDIPWWFWVAILMVITGVLGYLKVELSARVLSWVLATEILVTLVYAAAVTFQGGAEGLSMASFEPSNFLSGSIGLALLFAIMNFGGFEATAIYREEVKDPDRTIPLASTIFIFTVTALYGLAAWVIVQALGASKAVEAAAADPAGVVPVTVGQFVGNWAQLLVSVLVVSGVFAAILASHNITARYAYNLSVDRILPKRLASVHGDHGSPHQASVAVSLAALLGLAPFVFIDIDPNILYAQLSGVFGYAFILLLVITSFAVPLWLRRQKIPGLTVWHTTIAPGLAIVGLLAALYLTTTNFALLLGSSDGFAYVVMGCIYVVFLIGVVVAQVLKNKRPDIYARIGRQ
ncbi:putative amino acid permease [Mycolicibacterium confluentis]|uniref:Putative amino acid permease n=2 Tax=Mycolicibacterium confluentis TaxID=28047 RepID=A0A7I7XZE6_9MYCO|nr:putative amino acid permease [Mycolicibacterium confluentis]